MCGEYYDSNCGTHGGVAAEKFGEILLRALVLSTAFGPASRLGSGLKVG